MIFRVRTNHFLACLLSFAFLGCAHAPTSGVRSVKTLMPIMQRHYKALETRVRTHQWDATSATHLTELRQLLIELKSSPSTLFTKDAASWQRSCDELIMSVDNLTQAWSTQRESAIVAAFAQLKAGRDAAHNVFK